MSKKKRKRRSAHTSIAATGPVWHRSAEQATLDSMPKFNAYLGKAGAHGDAKYNRAKEKRNWKREEARDRGSLLFSAPYAPCSSF